MCNRLVLSVRRWEVSPGNIISDDATAVAANPTDDGSTAHDGATTADDAAKCPTTNADDVGATADDDGATAEQRTWRFYFTRYPEYGQSADVAAAHGTTYADLVQVSHVVDASPSILAPRTRDPTINGIMD